MAQKIVECVPNFSEGRDLKKLEKILEAGREVDGVDIVDVDSGYETHRSVVTLVGSPEAVPEAAFRMIARAAEVIDMSQHQGAHARHGATDVCPFVPVSGVTMDDCIALARALGERVGRELEIPVYIYDQAAIRPERSSLAHVRQGEYEALPEKLKDPAFEPDFGPAVFNPRTGVVTIGAREFLIAYNVNLNSKRKEHATDLAFEIREKGRAVRTDQTTGFYTSGKLLRYRPSEGIWPCAIDQKILGSFEELEAHYRSEYQIDLRAELAFFGQDPDALENEYVMKRGTFDQCRAVGWVIPEYDRAQITINLTNYKITPTHAVLDECRRLAMDRGLVVTGSEVVGVVPYDAMRQSGEYYLQQQGTSRGLPVNDVIETAIQGLGLRDVSEFDAKKSVLGLPEIDGELATLRVTEFTDEVSRPSPAPGGGSIAALAGALAGALASMVANISHTKKKKRKVHAEMEEVAIQSQQVKDALLRGIDEDTDAFNDVLTAMRLPQGDDAEKAAREAAIQKGYQGATEVPLGVARQCLEAMRLCRVAAEKGLAASVTDAAVGALMAHAGVQGAILNVRINLGSITDAAWVQGIRAQLGSILEEAGSLAAEIARITEERLPEGS